MNTGLVGYESQSELAKLSVGRSQVSGRHPPEREGVRLSVRRAGRGGRRAAQGSCLSRAWRGQLMALWSIQTNEMINGQSCSFFSGSKSVKYIESFFFSLTTENSP